MDSNKQELIRRLQSIMSDPNVPQGEYEAAKAALERVMAKYGISDEDLSRSEFEKHTFVLKGNREIQTLKVNICANYFTIQLGWSEDDYRKNVNFYHYKNQRTNYVSVNCKQADFVELMARTDFFVCEYKRQRSQFLEAFIQRNELFRARFKSDGESNELTDKDREMLKMAFAMCKADYHRQINGKATLIEYKGEKI